ncbi:MAG TPA: TonB-dependent receptor [Microscillaceae bacterium]|nr:TonB-dependent receptor [Microscillaceae bacterium]
MRAKLSQQRIFVQGVFKFLLTFLLLFTITIGLLKAQNRTVSGKVIDQKQQPIAGATVVVKGTNLGVATNAQGAFQLAVPQGKNKLLISILGYKSQELLIGQQTQWNITLEESIIQLGEGVVVTATRTKTDLQSLPQRVQVLDKNIINNTIANDVSDVLKKNAAVDVIQYPGLLSGVGMRGFRPEFSGVNQRTLLLIDGRPAGATNLALIDMNNIERIEVLKGPASALYGSRAMGGVINLITKKSQGNITGQVYASVGSFNTTETGLALGGNISKKLDFDLSFSNFSLGQDYRLGANNIFRDALGSGKAERVNENGEITEIDDARLDGGHYVGTQYNKYSGSLRLGYQINEKWRADIKGERFFANQVNTGPDIANIIANAATPGLKDVDRYSTDVSIQGQLAPNNTLIAKAYLGVENNIRYRVSSVANSTALNTYKSGDNNNRWVGGQIQDIIQLNAHTITVGVDYQHITQDNISFSSTGEENPVSIRRPNFTLGNLGIYAQGTLRFLEERLTATIGVRYENIQYNITGTDNFESRNQNNQVLSPSLGLNFKINEQLNLHGTFGTGFTTVGVFQIAGYDERVLNDANGNPTTNADIWQGNADLENPQSTTFDVGISFQSKKTGLNADVTFFNTNFTNNVVAQVQTDANIPTPSGSGNTVRNLNTYTNAAATTLNGLEIVLSYDLGALNNYKHSLKFFANSTVILEALEIRDIFLRGEIQLEMHNVADLTINYGIRYDNLKWFSTQLSGRYVGHRFDTDWSYYLGGLTVNPNGDYADIKYPSFMVLDYSLNFKVAGQHQIGLRIANLTDENYYEKRGFNLPGRAFYLRYTLSL